MRRGEKEPDWVFGEVVSPEYSFGAGGRKLANNVGLDNGGW